MLPLPHLYAIADAETLARRNTPLRAFAENLLTAGVTLLQYRDKTSGPQTILRACAEISEVFADTPATLILNDRADLAALAGWGVHVGQGDLTPVHARAVLDRATPNLSSRPEAGACAAVERSAVIGLSTHTLDELREANAGLADYLAIGPIFPTQTKLDASPVTGLDTLRQARALTAKPLVAIGGITLANARSVIDAGADSVAVISGLFVAGRTIRETAQDFLAQLR